MYPARRNTRSVTGKDRSVDAPSLNGLLGWFRNVWARERIVAVGETNSEFAATTFGGSALGSTQAMGRRGVMKAGGLC